MSFRFIWGEASQSVATDNGVVVHLVLFMGCQCRTNQHMPPAYISDAPLGQAAHNGAASHSAIAELGLVRLQMMQHSALEARVLPLTALLISSAALFHLIRIVAFLGYHASALWFWVPQPSLFHISAAGCSVAIVTFAAVSVSTVVVIEFRLAPSLPFAVFTTAVIGLSGLLICYATGSYRFRDVIAAQALQQLQRDGYRWDHIKYDPISTADALQRLGFSPPRPPSDSRK